MHKQLKLMDTRKQAVDQAIMDVTAQLQNQYVDFLTTLHQEGYLDDQFVQLQRLQDENSPNFVREVVTLFFQDSEKILANLTNALHNQLQVVDFPLVDAQVHQLKGSSSSIGAGRVKKACAGFRGYCEEKNFQGCLNNLNHLKHEYFIVKNKFETLFRLEQQIIAAGGKIPSNIINSNMI